MSDPPQQLYFGDNLEVLRRHIADESVDLVYLDPPFNSNADYNVLFAEHDGTEAASQIKAFDDTWTWDTRAAAAFREAVQSGHGRVPEAMQGFEAMLGDSDMLAYLSMMAPRLIELHRVLKPTGSIYLHCDDTASHYLKSLMDAVFSPFHFQNEIVWKRHNARSTSQRWPRLHDIIFVYSKQKQWKFEAQKVAGNEARVPHTLITGPDGKKYQTYELTGAGATAEGESGKPWRGYDPTPMGRHWAATHSQLDEWDRAGLIHWPKKTGSRGGFPRRRADEPFVPEARQIVVGDVWTDIDRINQSAKERLGYPTQKPEALLERIIAASSNEGDVVLDPFCGCGTAVAVAQKLNRRWIGIDITHLAIGLIKHRLFDSHRISDKQSPPAYEVVGEPTSTSGARALAREDRFQFQAWALGLVKARVASSSNKGADKGVDGRLFFHDDPDHVARTKQVVLSVKSGKVSVRDVRDLVGVLDREQDRGAVLGVLLTLEPPTRPMTSEAASAGFYASPWGTEHARLQILTIDGLLTGRDRIGMPATGDLRTFRKAPRRSRRGDAADGNLF